MDLIDRNILRSYIPEKSVGAVCDLLDLFPVRLNIVNPRKRIHGSYRRPKFREKYHLITVNNDLNPYTFLLTLLHEIAHLQAYIYHKSLRHGQEWKSCFIVLIKQFMTLDVFTDDVSYALERHIQSVKSSDFMDIFLTKTLQRYDNAPATLADGLIMLEDVPKDAMFLHGNKRMEKKSLMRKYYLCKDVRTNRLYRCHPLMKVSLV